MHFNSSMWFLALISAQPLILPSLMSGKVTFKTLDQGWLELMGGQGLMQATVKVTQTNQVFQSKAVTLLVSLAAISMSLVFILSI